MPESQLKGTLANYIVRTRRYLRETTPGKSHWTDPFLKQLFNTAYRRRCTQLFMAYEGFFTIIGTRDLIVNQEKYAWPSGFNRLLKLEIVRSDGRTVPLQRFERHQHVKHPPGNSGDSFTPSYRPIGGGFVLEPAPSDSVVGGLRLEYTGTPNELQVDGDNLHSDFPEVFDELLVIDTAVMALDQESVQEMGQQNNLLRLRSEWELDWERFIDGRMVSTQQVVPFIAHYNDA